VAARISARTSLVFGVYGIVAAASLWGASTGAVAGLAGLLLSGAVLVERPSGRLRRVGRIALALNALPVLFFGVILLLMGRWPWEI
jgi:hypothetical protein